MKRLKKNILIFIIIFVVFFSIAQIFSGEIKLAEAASWLDKQTGFSFLMEYSEIEKAILEEQGWERVHGIENGSNTLTFYRKSGGLMPDDSR